MRKDVRITVVGKVFKPNSSKILVLNKSLYEYLKLIKWYLRFNSTSKIFLHASSYERAKKEFNLNIPLIQTARDKAIEILKSFNENKKENSVLKLKRISIRFDKRCYNFSKTTNILTPYWLTLSLNRMERINLPIIFGKKQKERIENAFRGEWAFSTVEMVKHNGEWYAHFILKKSIEFVNEPETIIAIDRGEINLAAAIAISKSNLEKPLKGQFWKGSEIKRIKGIYSHIRRKLQEKKLLKKVKELGDREKRKVNQQLHMMANQIITYAKQFPKPIIVMEDLKGIRKNFKKSRKLNKRFHSLPFRKIQTIIEYKANLEKIEVRYIPKKEVKNTSKTCHRCGHVVQKLYKRELKCPKCNLVYNRDLNACINIAHVLMRDMGWRSSEPRKPANEEISVKFTLNAGNQAFSKVVHTKNKYICGSCRYLKQDTCFYIGFCAKKQLINYIVASTPSLD